ncbi:hypothetical protein NH14_020170 [Paraburkholderia sacchari]|uniref:Uncharacterized protein n=1 Tax=Paraburkholderia sacchari TaxID=159450 RepID=A0A8T6ZGU3_9BURK|nr:hypothetical protein [Paraburkholderia sacchari]
MLELLWEIHRLRATILRANQVRRRLTEGNNKPYLPGGIWEIFERELDAEPCLYDPPTPRQANRFNRDETNGRRKRRMRNG